MISSSSRFHLLLSLAFLVASSSCSDGVDPGYSLNEYREPSDTIARLRDRQYLRWIDETGTTPVSKEAPIVNDLDVPASILQAIVKDCRVHAWQELVGVTAAAAGPNAVLFTEYTPNVLQPTPAGANSECASPNRTYCQLVAVECVTSTLIDIAQNPGPRKLAVSYVAGSGGAPGTYKYYTIPPQDVFTRAALFAAAANGLGRYFQTGSPSSVTAVATPQFYEGCGTACTESFAVTPSRSTTVIQGVPVLLRALWETGLEAAKRAAEAYVAIADDLAAGVVDPMEGLADAAEARRHAAAVLLSVPYPAAVVPGTGICTSTANSLELENGVRVIRETAIDPKEIIGIDGDARRGSYSIVSDNTFEVDVCTRLVMRRSVSGSPCGSTMLRTSFFETLGTTPTSIAAARRRLADEIHNFDRSLTQELPDEELASGGNLTNRFAAIVAPPRELPGGVFSSRVIRKIDTPVEDWQGIGAFFANARLLLRWADYVPPSGNVVAAAAVAPMTQLARDIAAQAPIELSRSTSGSGSEIVTLLSVDPWEHLLVVHSNDRHHVADVVSCAVNGSVEGVPCSMSLLEEYRETPYAGGGVANVPAYFTDIYGDLRGEAIHVLRPRDPTATEVVPGTYDLLASYSFASTYAASPPLSSRGMAAILELEQLAGEILRPDPDACGSHRRSCAQLGGDFPLPLQSRLGPDGGVEGSWQYYLDLADQASAEADALGEQALLVSNETAQLSEASLQELTALCDANVSIAQIQALITASAKSDPIEALDWAVSQGTVTDPELLKLVRCVSTGSEAIVPYVTLGSRSLCAWHPAGSPTAICQLSSSTDNDAEHLACPRVVTPEDEAGCRLPGSSGQYEAIRLQAPSDAVLGYFSAPTDGDGGGGGGTQQDTRTEHCGALRALRYATQQWVSDEAVAEAWNDAREKTPILDPERARIAATGISFDAEAGNYARIFVGDSPLVSTGSLREGAATTGMCSGAGPDSGGDECPATGGATASIFCGWTPHCTDRLVRAQLNARLFLAASTARWFGQQSLDGFVYPSLHYRDEGPGGPAALSTYLDTGATIYTWGDGDKTYAQANFESNLWIWAHPFTGTDLGVLPLGGSFLPVVYPTMFRGQTLRGERRYHYGSEQPTDMTNKDRTDARNVLFGLLGGPPVAHSDSVFAAMAEPDRLVTLRGGKNDLPFLRDGVQAANYVSEPGRRVGQIRAEVAFDALELLCMADRGGDSRNFGCGDPTVVSSSQGMRAAAFQLQCMADSVKENAGKAIFAQFPLAAVDALRYESPIGAAAVTGGQFGQQVIEIRTAMTELHRAAGDVQFQTKSFAQELRSAQIRLDTIETEQKVARLQLYSQIANLATECASASVNDGKFWNIAGAALTCANAAYQTANATQRFRLGQHISDNEEQQIYIDVENASANRGKALLDLSDLIAQNLDRIDAAMMGLERSRASARHALRGAFFLDADATGTVLASNVYARQRLRTANLRYQSAFAFARSTAHLARLAIEQRFAVRFQDLTRNLSAVEAPSRWEGSLCTMAGLDYDRIVREGRIDVDADYADEYVGSYVDKLRAFVLSYDRDFNSSTGSDTVVMSLRDDVLHVRDACTSPSPNLLGHSTAFTATSSTGDPGWNTHDCAANATDAGQPAELNCISVERKNVIWSTSTSTISTQGTPVVHEVTFGPSFPACANPSDSACPCNTSNCSWAPEATLAQRVDLDVGAYRLAWYERDADARYPAGAIGTLPPIRFRVVDETLESRLPPERRSEAVVPLVVSPASNEALSNTLNDFDFVNATFDLRAATHVRIELVNPSGTHGDKILVAGIHLARDLGGSPVLEREFATTTQQGVRALADVCEDTDGDKFRTRGWVRKCVSLCPNGYGRNCPQGQQQVSCFHETTFDVTNEAIEAGTLFGASGFARGNFNYRTATLAVNFVGTASRTCTNTDLPSTCYSAGYVPYSLQHLGPYDVRAYDGLTYTANLFPGSIEHARGLAAERYVTNPISSADQALLSQYTRTELAGRPITGRYLLRVWEEPGVNFDGIEDVQVVLNYQYWTRNR